LICVSVNGAAGGRQIRARGAGDNKGMRKQLLRFKILCPGFHPVNLGQAFLIVKPIIKSAHGEFHKSTVSLILQRHPRKQIFDPDAIGFWGLCREQFATKSS
jgi:hypothetical protein